MPNDEMTNDEMTNDEMTNDEMTNDYNDDNISCPTRPRKAATPLPYRMSGNYGNYCNYCNYP